VNRGTSSTGRTSWRAGLRTADEERLLHTPVDVKDNGGYFAFSSLAPRDDFVAWSSVDASSINVIPKGGAARQMVHHRAARHAFG
jgi:hypothetical protein